MKGEVEHILPLSWGHLSKMRNWAGRSAKCHNTCPAWVRPWLPSPESDISSELLCVESSWIFLASESMPCHPDQGLSKQKPVSRI